jgi:hypothetical protein
MSKKFIGICSTVILLGMGLFTFSYAQTDPASMDIGGLFAFILEKLKLSQWLAAFGAVLVGAVWLLRGLIAPRVKWFGSKLGGWVLSFLTAVALAAGTALMAGGSVSVGLLMSAVSAAFVAAGGWEGVSDLLAAKEAAKAPVAVARRTKK